LDSKDFWRYPKTDDNRAKDFFGFEKWGYVFSHRSLLFG